MTRYLNLKVVLLTFSIVLAFSFGEPLRSMADHQEKLRIHFDLPSYEVRGAKATFVPAAVLESPMSDAGRNAGLVSWTVVDGVIEDANVPLGVDLVAVLSRLRVKCQPAGPTMSVGFAGSLPFRIGPRDLARGYLEVRFHKLQMLSVRVRATSGRPLTSRSVQLLTGSRSITAITDESGTANFLVRDGAYTVLVDGTDRSVSLRIDKPESKPLVVDVFAS